MLITFFLDCARRTIQGQKNDVKLEREEHQKKEVKIKMEVDLHKYPAEERRREEEEERKAKAEENAARVRYTKVMTRNVQRDVLGG